MDVTTPSPVRDYNGRIKKSPGDALGNGKSQRHITQFYSSLSSGRKRKKHSVADSPAKRKRLLTSLKQIESSDDSDDVFTQPPKAAVSKTRLNLVKRRLYPVTSSPNLSRSRQLKRSKSTYLSDSDPDDHMDNSQDVRVVQSQSRMRLSREKVSQTVVISSSDESDFELHNSKTTQSFLNQSSGSVHRVGPLQRDSLDSDSADENKVNASNGQLSSIYLQETILPSDTKHEVDWKARNSPWTPPPGHAIYNEKTIDPRLCDSVDLRDDEADKFDTLPESAKSGGIVEASDVEESILLEHSDNVSQGIPLSELLDMSHISCSSSDFSCVYSDDQPTKYPCSDIPTEFSSLLVEDSGTCISPILDSVLDASAEFFSDVSLSDGKGEQDIVRSPSPTKELVNIALEVAALEGPESFVAARDSSQSDGADLPKPSVDDNVTQLGDSVAALETAPEFKDLPRDLSQSGRADLPKPSVDAYVTPDDSLPAELTMNETKIVCGFQPLDITQHLESKRPNVLLLDAIIAECQIFAEDVFHDRLRSFVTKYSNLPHYSKAVLHTCLIDFLEDSHRWLKYSPLLAPSIDNLVSSGILEYLKDDEWTTKLNYLSFSEISEVVAKIGHSPSESIETMRSIITKSGCTNEQVKELCDYVNKKFVRLTGDASFCIIILIELFVLPLNLCDKFYTTVDLVRFVNTLLRDVSSKKCSLLPLKLNKMVASECVLNDLSALYRLKTVSVNVDSVYRVNDICASLAVLDASFCDTSNRPTYTALVTNYVHALDDLLKTLPPDEFSSCVYLGVLLKQNVTGRLLKVKWCRERMKHLAKLLDSAKIFDEFSKILNEPVSPVEYFVRSEFVLSTFGNKKIGLSQEEKYNLTKLLRPTSHKTTQIWLQPSNNVMYSVLTKKPKGKNFNLIRANIFQKYHTDFPCGVEDNGCLLSNAIFLTFWSAIYLDLDDMFINKYQNAPLDWGSKEFFTKREKYINNFTSDMKKLGLPGIFNAITSRLEQFTSYRSVVDWQLVASHKSTTLSLLEALGLEVFLSIGSAMLANLDETVGMADAVLWNPESKKVKFLGLKKPQDPAYPFQILWLEKLRDLGVDAEEVQVTGNTAPQCSYITL